MAITLLAPVQWGGTQYLTGQSIPGLTVAEEAGLVSSNRAAWVGGSQTAGGAVPVTATTNPLTGGVELSAGGSVVARNPILSGASAGQTSGWLPLAAAPERFVYQLDGGSTATTFSVDISADGVTSLGQAFTGSWASSALAEITFPIMISNPLAKFFRWNVVSGGPLSVSRGV